MHPGTIVNRGDRTRYFRCDGIGPIGPRPERRLIVEFVKSYTGCRASRGDRKPGSTPDKLAALESMQRACRPRWFGERTRAVSNCPRVCGSLNFPRRKLPGLDSNQGLQLQRLTCYRYTTGHRNQGRRQAQEAGRGGPQRNSPSPPAG